MKCGYATCKLGGNVEKEDSVKIKGRYYHHECAHEKQLKQEIETYYRDNYNKNEPLQNIRTAISNYINKNGYSAEYILWCLKNKKPKINSMYGLSYTLFFKQNELDFKKEVANKTKLEFDNNEYDDFMSDTINYKSKKNKTWGDIWK